MVDNLSLFVCDHQVVQDSHTEEVEATDLCFTFEYDDEDDYDEF